MAKRKDLTVGQEVVLRGWYPRSGTIVDLRPTPYHVTVETHDGRRVEVPLNEVSTESPEDFRKRNEAIKQAREKNRQAVRRQGMIRAALLTRILQVVSERLPDKCDISEPDKTMAARLGVVPALRYPGPPAMGYVISMDARLVLALAGLDEEAEMTQIILGLPNE